MNADIIIYTNGSLKAGIFEGGSAAIVTRGDPESPEVIDSMKIKGAAFTCSYEEEVEGMKEAAEWITDNCTGEERS